MKMIFDAQTFFDGLDARMTKCKTTILTDEQKTVVLGALYAGMGFTVFPQELVVDCGMLHVEACNHQGEKAGPNDVVLACNFSLPGFPLESQVQKLALEFDATSTDVVSVKMTIIPFKIELPNFNVPTPKGTES